MPDPEAQDFTPTDIEVWHVTAIDVDAQDFTPVEIVVDDVVA